MHLTKNTIAMYGHYFFFFAAVGFFSPFLPLYLAEIQLDSLEIGFLLSIPPLTNILFQAKWGSLADRRNKRKEYLVLTLILSAAFSFFLPFPKNPWVLGIILFFYAASNCAINPLSDAILLNTLEDRTNYGTVRSWGSIGFAVAAAVGGIIFSYIPLASFGFVTCAVLLITLGWAKNLPNPRLTETLNNVKIKSPVKAILKTPKVPVFLLSSAFVMLTHNAYLSFFGWHLKTLNTPNFWIGVAWFVGAASEALVFLKGKDWLKRYPPEKLLMLAAFAFALRWLLYAFIPNYGWIIVLQLSQSICFALFYLAGVEYLNCLLPFQLQATMQSVFALITFGVAAILGNLGSGWILQIFDIKGLYLILSLLSASGGLCIWKFILSRDRGETAQ